MPKLFQESGGTAKDRSDEALVLYKRIMDIYDDLNEKESDFIGSINDRFHHQQPISPKQIFWLRDIAEKYGV